MFCLENGQDIKVILSPLLLKAKTEPKGVHKW